MAQADTHLVLHGCHVHHHGQHRGGHIGHGHAVLLNRAEHGLGRKRRQLRNENTAVTVGETRPQCGRDQG
eukprot:4628434-Prymnesium_polylepis.2